MTNFGRVESMIFENKSARPALSPHSTQVPNPFDDCVVNELIELRSKYHVEVTGCLIIPLL